MMKCRGNLYYLADKFIFIPGSDMFNHYCLFANAYFYCADFLAGRLSNQQACPRWPRYGRQVIQLILFLISFHLNAQLIKKWDKTFGGDTTESLSSLQQTTDGGYILGGTSYSGISGDKTQASRGDMDYWIVKTDANGIKQWDKTFGGDGDDGLFSLQQTIDGGYILGGYSNSGIGGDKTQASRGDYDYWIVKTDANGMKQWDKTFGGDTLD